MITKISKQTLTHFSKKLTIIKNKSNIAIGCKIKFQLHLVSHSTTKLPSKLKELTKREKQTETNVECSIKTISTLVNELERIALRPKLTTIGDQIDKLIETEEEATPRNPTKIKMLKELKKKERDIQKVETNIYDIGPDLNGCKITRKG